MIESPWLSEAAPAMVGLGFESGDTLRSGDVNVLSGRSKVVRVVKKL